MLVFFFGLSSIFAWEMLYLHFPPEPCGSRRSSCEAVCFFFLPEARLGCGLGELRGGGDHGPLRKTRKGWCRDGLRCPLRSELVGGVEEWAGGVQV